MGGGGRGVKELTGRGENSEREELYRESRG